MSMVWAFDQYPHSNDLLQVCKFLYCGGDTSNLTGFKRARKVCLTYAADMSVPNHKGHGLSFGKHNHRGSIPRRG